MERLSIRATKCCIDLECACACHRTPGVVHCFPCCDKPPLRLTPEKPVTNAKDPRLVLARKIIEASLLGMDQPPAKPICQHDLVLVGQRGPEVLVWQCEKCGEVLS